MLAHDLKRGRRDQRLFSGQAASCMMEPTPFVSIQLLPQVLRMPAQNRSTTLAHVGWTTRPTPLMEALSRPCPRAWLQSLQRQLERDIQKNAQSGPLRSLLKAWLQGPNPFPRELKARVIEHACRVPTTDLGTIPTRKEFYRQCNEEELRRLLRYHRNKAPFAQAVFERDDTHISTWRTVAHQATGHGSKRKALRGGLPEEALSDPIVRKGLLKPHNNGPTFSDSTNQQPPTSRVVARLLFYSSSPQVAHELIEEYSESTDNAIITLGRTTLSEMAHHDELPVEALSPHDWLTLIEGALHIAHVIDHDTWRMGLSRLAQEHPDPNIKTVFIRVQCSKREELRKAGFRALAARKQSAASDSLERQDGAPRNSLSR